MNTNDLIEQGCNLESGTTFSDRLQIALKDEPLLSFAKRSGVGEGSLRQYLKGSEPGLEKVIAIAKASGVSVGWLASGEGAPEPQKPEEIKALASAMRVPAGQTLALGMRENYPGEHAQIFRRNADSLGEESSGVAVPLISVTASAGHGAVALDERVEDHIQFNPARLHSMGLNPRESFIISAMGDSMNPLIRSGDMMLCSRADHHIKGRDGIAVVRLEGDLLVKRIQRMPGGKVRLSSENPDYSPFEIALNDGTDFAVLGLVMWAFKRV
jgi:phage repressor protein C with HTH and peptisase S24 domain